MVVIDGATLHSAASIFVRLKNKRVIRPINILSLCSLIDSFVSFDRALVDETAWAHFEEYAPEDWARRLRQVVTVAKIDLAPYGTRYLDCFLHSDITAF
jgi:hypothetical protein